MIDWQTKCWGETRELHHCEFYSKHELMVKAGGYCSLHYHEDRANRFLVQSGVIEIIEMFGPIAKRTILRSGEMYDVASLVPHLFAVHKSGAMFEEYYSDRNGMVRRDDIIRIVEGGFVRNVDDFKFFPYSLLTQWTNSITM